MVSRTAGSADVAALLTWKPRLSPGETDFREVYPSMDMVCPPRGRAPRPPRLIEHADASMASSSGAGRGVSAGLRLPVAFRALPSSLRAPNPPGGPAAPVVAPDRPTGGGAAARCGTVRSFD